MLETDRLLLRPPVPGDVLAVAEAIGDPEVMRFIGGGETRTIDDAVAQIERMQRAWEADGFGRFIVVRQLDGLPVGHVGLLAWDATVWRTGIRAEIGDGAEIELGWILLRHAWGCGYATEAAVAVRDWALREVRPPRLISLIHRENTRSSRVATRIGEHFERPITTERGIPLGLWTYS